ncbi:hypothetical protein CgunFtcFv8_004773 [Champsocephalus gunnari]|uniref:Uncharacterized protein n=1 Tax=Champsocephalus gunnari TaxID=52237 RepID=A0AAN8E118_CHAGU|nr:hypothetical protein CgunFtcFv8_004770 [Champsocephalus gunnari]KAK5933120.1 hypothetical protein CgunFtcFv8_004773 [Champsocephalus gunnari]
MGRILEAGNKNFADQIKARRESFCENGSGVWNKALKPPMGLDRTGPAFALMKKTDVLELSAIRGPQYVSPDTAHHQSSHPGLY